MALPELKQLDKLIALCRKRGISEITVDGVTLKLGDAPEKRSRASKSTSSSRAFHDDNGQVDTDELSPEQLLYFSVQDTLGVAEESTT